MTQAYLSCSSSMISQNRDHQASWEGTEGFPITILDKPSLIRIGGILSVCSLVT